MRVRVCVCACVRVCVRVRVRVLCVHARAPVGMRGGPCDRIVRVFARASARPSGVRARLAARVFVHLSAGLKRVCVR
jgi:hypothetical protein